MYNSQSVAGCNLGKIEVNLDAEMKILPLHRKIFVSKVITSKAILFWKKYFGAFFSRLINQCLVLLLNIYANKYLG